MECAKCKIQLDEDDVYEVKGKCYCEDCAMSQQRVLKKCDPGAVYSATMARKQAGQTGTDGLTQLQKDIYQFIEDKNGANMKELIAEFKLPQEQIDTELTVLRHLELGKGQQREDGVYFVIWES